MDVDVTFQSFLKVGTINFILRPKRVQEYSVYKKQYYHEQQCFAESLDVKSPSSEVLHHYCHHYHQPEGKPAKTFTIKYNRNLTLQS